MKKSTYQGKIYELNTDALLSIVSKMSGDYPKTISLYKDILAKAEDYGFTMYEMSTNNDLYEIYKETGKADSADYYYGKFLRLKDSLEDKSGFRSVEKMEFLSEIDEINDEVEKLSMKRQEERRIRVLIVAILIIVVVVLVALLWVHLNLKRNHQNLFKRNEEMLRLDTQHKLLREQWEEERNDLINTIEEYKKSCGAAVGKDKDNIECSHEEGLKNEEESSTAEVENSEGNETAEINDQEELKRIYAKVLGVMENSKEIYKQGFSIHELQKLVKASARNVSKAINVCHDGNFHQLLTEYRIREVTRIMHSREADNLTIEAIAENTGFKNRTYFSALFKKSTGLTPSEYIKMVKSKDASE